MFHTTDLYLRRSTGTPCLQILGGRVSSRLGTRFLVGLPGRAVLRAVPVSWCPLVSYHQRRSHRYSRYLYCSRFVRTYARRSRPRLGQYARCRLDILRSGSLYLSSRAACASGLYRPLCSRGPLGSRYSVL